MTWNAEDYVDVAERIRTFKAEFPNGCLQSWVPPYVVEVAGKSFVVYAAAAYRNAEDARPGIGWAWEPVPGPTNFTKDSELQNAETSAWGRAIVALGFETKKIASAEEVRNRSAGGASVGDAGGASPLPSPPTPAGYLLPKSWNDVQDAMKPYGQGTVDEFNAFGVQAREYLYPGVEKLASNESTILRQHTAKAVKYIRDKWAVDVLPPPDRTLMREAWKLALDLPEDIDLEGPPWRMGPDETDRPVREAA